MRTLNRTPATGFLSALLALALVSPAPAAAQDEEQSSEEEEEPEARWLAVTGADVHTGTGAVLRGATVLCKDGKIEEIGYDPWMPEEAEVLDATGYRVYPGLVAIRSFGLFGTGSDLENGFDPFNQNLVLALGAGITSAVNGDEAAKLKYGDLEGVVMRENVFHHLSYTKSNPSGKRSTREKLERAAEYVREYRQWEEDVKRDEDLDEPSKRGVDMNMVAVLRGEKRATFRADDRTDLLEIARLAQRFGFRPILMGCREGWTVADELGRAGAAAIVTPRDRRPKNAALIQEGGSSIENAAILHEAGVPVTIIPSSPGISLGGIVGRDLMHFTVEAGFAVRGGLPEDAAIAGITIEPARLLGIDHRVGTLEEGKDADLIVTDGDLLHYQTFVQWAVVDGEVVYDKEAHLYFAHIRPRPESNLAPEERVDPGEDPPEEEDDEATATEESGGGGG